MNKPIQKAIQNLEAATAALKSVLAVEQANCAHERVIHSKWRSSDYGPAFKARRLCLNCGLEEEAKNSGWGDDDRDFNRLKTGGFHKIVSAEELYNSRFPECAVDVQ